MIEVKYVMIDKNLIKTYAIDIESHPYQYEETNLPIDPIEDIETDIS